MLRRHSIKSSWCRLKARQLHKSAQSHCKKSDEKCQKVTKIRNIGIMAHIDAGKTTTTERMLFYSGLIKHMGEVHHGNTVTDYMEQERQRGITITSAAVTFDWKNHRFNLIDTPGHIDFTMEVEQTLRVMDGGIVVLDGSAGVEAQTVTVCKQADKYAIPKLIYVNKMDRPDSNFDMNLKSIESKLELFALPVQYPIKDEKTGALIGIIDILTLEKLTFDTKNLGINFIRSKLEEDSDDPILWDIATEKRRILTDRLSNLDDELAEIIIEEESLEKVSADVLVNSLRRVTRERKGVPVLLGSSYKNIGVQPLMDGIVFYLPSPEGNPHAKLYRHFQDNLSARAFKIVYDKRKGPITFCRIYTGSLKKGDKLYNIQKQQTEQVQRVHVPFADDYEEVTEVSHGNIAAVTGLKLTTTGDLMTSNASVASRAKNSMAKYHHSSEVNTFFGIDSKMPQPVFFCSIEPPSLSQQTALDVALQQLTREDSSLKVTQDVETGQTILAGMGELHIEIIKERIRTEYKIEADLGPLQIAYRETILDSIKDTFNVQHQIGTSNHNVLITLSLIPNYEGTDPLLFDKTKESASNLANIHPRLVGAIKSGVAVALLHGPKLSCPVMNVGVKLHWLEIARGTSDTIVTATVSQSVKKLLQAIGTELLEPIMQLEIVTNETHSSKIIADLTRRRGEIKQIGIRGQYKIIEALAPLSELLGYATNLRITTSGNGTFSLEFSHYRIMAPAEAEKAVKQVNGF